MKWFRWFREPRVLREPVPRFPTLVGEPRTRNRELRFQSLDRQLAFTLKAVVKLQIEWSKFQSRKLRQTADETKFWRASASPSARP